MQLRDSMTTRTLRCTRTRIAELSCHFPDEAHLEADTSTRRLVFTGIRALYDLLACRNLFLITEMPIWRTCRLAIRPTSERTSSRTLGGQMTLS